MTSTLNVGGRGEIGRKKDFEWRDRAREESEWVVKGCLITPPPACPHRKFVLLSNFKFPTKYFKVENTGWKYKCSFSYDDNPTNAGFGVLSLLFCYLHSCRELLQPQISLLQKLWRYFWKTDSCKSQRRRLPEMHSLNGVKCWWIMHRD